MNRIPSFSIDHTKLKRGVYLSRQDDDIMTWDVRMKEPNHGDYLSQGALHTIEHLFATYARNSRYQDGIIYIGPMGCRTGFYFLVRDTMTHAQAIDLVRDCFAQIAVWDGEIPGATRVQCGNYLDQDLPGARAVAADMCAVLKNWTEEKLKYEE